MSIQAMKSLPQKASRSPHDKLVVFGEVFNQGYVNGLIDEAKKNNVGIIYSTVGRRNKEQELVGLSQEEISEKNQSPLLNTPLEAGFDMWTTSSGFKLNDYLKGVKLSAWKDLEFPPELTDAMKEAEEDFRVRVRAYLAELKPHLHPEGSILFAHTMAGGIPRAKILMPLLNRIFKGSGDRYLSSKEFWESDLGKIAEASFLAVTAKTFQILIEETKELREDLAKTGQTASYVAFGYHGCEALVDGSYVWQSYAPYLQGWAKLELENVAKNALDLGIQASVFNCPEILTNSSSVFLGVEVCLYPLIGALKKECPNESQVIFENCNAKLTDDNNIDKVNDYTQNYLQSDHVESVSKWDSWPEHNNPDQMAAMKDASQTLMSWHKDSKNLITKDLSEVVFKSCGYLMFHEGWAPKKPVWWLGHDIVSKAVPSWIE